MGKQFILIVLLVLCMGASAAMAEAPSGEDLSAKDEKIIAVMEILELMEITEHMALYQDMIFLMEEESDESQE